MRIDPYTNPHAILNLNDVHSFVEFLIMCWLLFSMQMKQLQRKFPEMTQNHKSGPYDLFKSSDAI